MTGCDGRSRNEFAEIIFRISGSGPDRGFSWKFMELKSFYLTLDLFKISSLALKVQGVTRKLSFFTVLQTI